MSRSHKRARTSKKENLRVFDVDTNGALGVAMFGCASGAIQDNVITAGYATNIGASPAAGRTSIYVLNQIPSQNNTGQSRSGRSLVMKSMAIKGKIDFRETQSDACVNMYLIYDRDSTNAKTTLNSTDVTNMLLIGATNYPAGNSNYNACPFSNVDNAPRYKIVKHWALQCPGSGSQTLLMDDFVSLKDKETSWISSDYSGNYASMARGALYLVMVSDQLLASAPFFAGGVRIYFKE